jgi:predicted hydrocarbon binding protein
MALEQKRGELQGLLVFMASLSDGLEQTLGRGATTITFRAGRTIGLKSDVSSKATDVKEALDIVRKELEKRGINWEFELWKPNSASSFFYDKEGKKAAKLLFHNCMVRCALFRYSHEQKQSLCMMNHGLFCGFLQKVTGKRAELDIIHAGENGCLKELTQAEE